MTHADSSATEVRHVSVLDTAIAYRERGHGPPLVFLHGNPTSSHVWRNVMPLVVGRRCVAPDLVGMGQSGKPKIGYRFVDHARYLDAWFDALDLRDVVLVGYDWGGVLALDWARRHPERVRGVAVFETFLRPMHWRDWAPQGEELFRALRTPGVGERLVLEENAFLARSLAHGVMHGLDERDRAVYYAPYPDPESRRPLLQWPREIPIDGDPTDVAAVIHQNADWAARSHETPKLLITFEGTGLSNAPSVVDWARNTFAVLDVKALGAAGHHAPEDAPEPIATAINGWLVSRRIE